METGGLRAPQILGGHMLTPVVTIVPLKDFEHGGKKYQAGAAYMLEVTLAKRLHRTRPGLLRVMTERADAPRRDRTVHTEGIRHG
jgi:hypothetical protein